jgi:hypothetical protein
VTERTVELFTLNRALEQIQKRPDQQAFQILKKRSAV